MLERRKDDVLVTTSVLLPEAFASEVILFLVTLYPDE